jgi:hypothetical protein
MPTQKPKHTPCPPHQYIQATIVAFIPIKVRKYLGDHNGD